MQNLKDLPALILAYNRYDKFIKCFDNLHKQGIKNLFVSIDGPKNQFDKNSQEKILYFCKNNELDINIKINYLEKNYGCREGPIKGITWFFKKNRFGVILEDDVLVSSKCIQAFAFLLNERSRDNEIMTISSFNELTNKSRESIYSIPVWRSWGWATWAERWHYHLDFSQKIRSLSIWDLYNLMPKDLRSIETAKIVKASQLNLLDAWDYEFNFTHVVNQKNSLTLGGINTLVYGFDDSATHKVDIDSIGIDFNLFHEREFNLKDVVKPNKNNLIILLRKCGFFYQKNNFKYFKVKTYLKFLYISFVFYLRKAKRIMYREF